METKVNDERRAALTGWEDEGGAAASTRVVVAETQREESAGRAKARAAVDDTHHSSTRGEHRYPDTHQTPAEQKSRQERDDLKRKLEGTS